MTHEEKMSLRNNILSELRLNRRVKIYDLKHSLKTSENLIDAELKDMHEKQIIQLLPADDPLELNSGDYLSSIICYGDQMFFVKLI